VRDKRRISRRQQWQIGMACSPAVRAQNAAARFAAANAAWWRMNITLSSGVGINNGKSSSIIYRARGGKGGADSGKITAAWRRWARRARASQQTASRGVLIAV